jgi:hypothetical protein
VPCVITDQVAAQEDMVWAYERYDEDGRILGQKKSCKTFRVALCRHRELY